MDRLTDTLMDMIDSLKAKLASQAEDGEKLQHRLTIYEEDLQGEVVRVADLRDKLNLVYAERDNAREQLSNANGECDRLEKEISDGAAFDASTDNAASAWKSNWRRDSMEAIINSFSNTDLTDALHRSLPDKRILAIKHWRGFTGLNLLQAKQDMDNAKARAEGRPEKYEWSDGCTVDPLTEELPQ